MEIKTIKYFKKGVFKVTYEKGLKVYFTIETFELTHIDCDKSLDAINMFLRSIKLKKLQDKEFDDIIYYGKIIIDNTEELERVAMLSKAQMKEME